MIQLAVFLMTVILAVAIVVTEPDKEESRDEITAAEE